MHFVDEAHIVVKSGKGGDGCSSFRRERAVPYGGPDGGDGGRGADILIIATSSKNTLQDLRGHSIWKGKSGVPGRPRNCTGANAQPVKIFVPIGTRVFAAGSDDPLIDLTEEGQQWIAVKGGNGGWGNTRFKSSVNRAPRKCLPGLPGEEKRLRLELILMADIGLLGFPNAGKSTLISRISAAKPKIANYHFTTLVPSLGVVDMGFEGSFTVADIPGLIRGASQGAGLGLQFLRHLRRTRIHLHLISLGPDEDENIEQRYLAIRQELQQFDPELAARDEVILLTKTDLLPAEDLRVIQKKFQEFLPAAQILCISSLTGDGLKVLKRILWTKLQSVEQ